MVVVHSQWQSPSLCAVGAVAMDRKAQLKALMRKKREERGSSSLPSKAVRTRVTSSRRPTLSCHIVSTQVSIRRQVF